VPNVALDPTEFQCTGYYYVLNHVYSLLFAMKTLISIEGIKVNDPALLSQYKSPLLGQPSLS